MDGFRLVKLNEVIRQVDIVITCTGTGLGWAPQTLPQLQLGDPKTGAGGAQGFLWGSGGCREQERGDQGTSGQDEEQLHRLQHGALQHRDRRGERGVG